MDILKFHTAHSELLRHQQSANKQREFEELLKDTQNPLRGTIT